VPSPLSSYKLVSSEVSVQSYMEGRPIHFPKEEVKKASYAICEQVRNATVELGAEFLDVRPSLREASDREFVHGPRDFKHLNRAGMTVLGRAVAEKITRPVPRACSQLP